MTAATRLFQKGIDEQLIMERTGHRSIDGVRTYKRTCSEQDEKLSNVLHGNSPSKKPKLDVEITEVSMKTKANSKQGDEVGNKENVSQGSGAQPMLNFNNCHSITINYQH